MAIKLHGAQTSDFNRDKPAPGTYICVVKDLREKSGHKGEGFWADFAVESGGTSPKGFEFSWGIYPKNARGQGGLTQEQVEAKELGKIVSVLAAVVGCETKDLKPVADLVLEKATARPCPYAGRRVVIEVVAHKNGKGETTAFYRPHALLDGTQQPLPLPLPEASAAAPLAPPAPLPSLPVPPPAVFPPPGWTAYPGHPGFFYCGQEVKSEADLRSGR